MTDLRTRALRGGIAERLVYADWLEERGDPLGELLRLACEYVQERDSRPHPFGSDKCSYCIMKHDRVLLRMPAILAPLLADVKAAWPVCHKCDQSWGPTYNSPRWRKSLCRYCQSTGRIGNLWRECPECKDGKRSKWQEPIFHDKHVYHGIEISKCTRCEGTGVLLECPCKRCLGGKLAKAGTKVNCIDDGEGGTWQGYVETDCPVCNATGYIPSPLQPLYETLSLTFSPEADGVRRGDAGVILGLLEKRT